MVWIMLHVLPEHLQQPQHPVQKCCPSADQQLPLKFVSSETSLRVGSSPLSRWFIKMVNSIGSTLNPQKTAPLPVELLYDH